MLLGDLLLFDGLLIISTEFELGDGGIFENNVEVAESFLETVADLPTDLLTVSRKLIGRVACDDRSQDLVDDRRQDTSMVVMSKLSVNVVDLLVVRSEHNSQGDAHHLQV